MDSEPDLLPENSFDFKNKCAYKRMYPPSTQSALSEMGEIYLQKNDLVKAEACFERAIALRENNFQAPYQFLAVVREKQEKTLEMLQLLAKKVEIFLGSKQKRGQIIYFEVKYESNSDQKIPLDGDYYTRIVVNYPHEYALKVADAYFQLKMYDKAQQMYKKTKQFLNDENYTQTVTRLTKINFKALKIKILENQMQLAFATKDYWQARELNKQIKVLDETNEQAVQMQKKLREVLNN